jgi:mRNA interferase RelE/StbE
MSRRTLGYSKDFLKQIADLPPKHFKQVISKALSLVEVPMPPDAKQLSGYKGLYRVDSGEYRIIYTYDDDYVDLILVGKRNDDDVYRQLSRKREA